MHAKALTLYTHCLKTLGIDHAKLTEEAIEKYRSCCKVLVRVNPEATYDERCTPAFNFRHKNPGQTCLHHGLSLIS